MDVDTYGLDLTSNPERRCEYCRELYPPTARGQRYCGKQKVRGTCSWKVAREQTRKYIADHPEKVAQYEKAYQERLNADPVRLAKYQAKRRAKICGRTVFPSNNLNR